MWATLLPTLGNERGEDETLVEQKNGAGGGNLMTEQRSKRVRKRGNGMKRLRGKEGEEGAIGPSSFPFTDSLGEVIC